MTIIKYRVKNRTEEKVGNFTYTWLEHYGQKVYFDISHPEWKIISEKAVISMIGEVPNYRFINLNMLAFGVIGL